MKNITKVSKSNLRRFVSSNHLRTNLHHPYLDTEEEVLVCANGSLMVIIPVEIEDGDVSGLIHIDAFDLKKGDLGEAEYVVREDKTEVHTEDETLEFETPRGNFPDWKLAYRYIRIYGISPVEMANIALNTEEMENLLRGLSIKKWRKNSSIQCTLYGERRAIEFEVRGKYSEQELDHIIRGVIMPLPIKTKNQPE